MDTLADRMHRLLKEVYRRLPFKKPFFEMVRRVYGCPASYQRMYFQGPFEVAIDPAHRFRLMQHNRHGIETELFWNGLGGWEGASMNLWVKLCAEAEVILDIGAAEGTYALVAQSLRPEATVIAFEPLAQAHVQLRENVWLNGSKILARKEALSNFHGEADFFVDAVDSNEGSLVAAASGPNSAKGDRVPVTTLANVIEERKLGRIDLMKIDVECAEPEVLEGMGPSLERFKPSLIVEILNDEVGQRVERLVSGLDYVYFDVNDDPRNGPLGVHKVASIRQGVCLNYLLVSRAVADRLGLD